MYLLEFVIIILVATLIQSMLPKNNFWKSNLMFGLILLVELNVLSFFKIDYTELDSVFTNIYLLWGLIDIIRRRFRHKTLTFSKFQKIIGYSLLVYSFVCFLVGRNTLVIALVGAVWLLLLGYEGYQKIFATKFGMQLKQKYQIEQKKITMFLADKKKRRITVTVLAIALVAVGYIIYNPYAGHVYKYRDQDSNQTFYIVTDRGIANRKIPYVIEEDKEFAMESLENPSAFKDSYSREQNNHDSYRFKYDSLKHMFHCYVDSDTGGITMDDVRTFSNKRLADDMGDVWTLVK